MSNEETGTVAMTPRFEPQRGAYAVSVNDTARNPYKIFIDYEARDGQTVTMALAEAVTGVALVHKGTNPRYAMTFTDGTASGVQVTGTAVVNVSVAQNGHSTTVYTLNVAYSIPEPEPVVGD